jgi:hypothetical protein
MYTILSVTKALAVIVIATILGGVAGYVLFDVSEYRLPGGEWHPVSLGQEKATRILGIDSESYSAVYVQTNQGTVYSCDSTGCKPAPVPQVSSTRFDKPRYTPPQPPGDVNDSLGVSYTGLCSGQANFVILSDGSVWTWNKVGCCEIGCVVVLVYPLCGLVLGLMAGILVLVVWRRRRRKVSAASGLP